jgi:uncharacterized protein YhfF
MKNESATKLWDVFLKTHPDVESTIIPQIKTFGTDGTLSTIILDTILKGKASAWIEPLLALQGREDSLPVTGRFFVLMDEKENARAIVQIKSSRLHPFFSVPQDFIALEGNGKKNAEAWKTEVWDLFAKQLTTFGKPLRESSIMVCTAFALVFKAK